MPSINAQTLLQILEQNQQASQTPSQMKRTTEESQVMRQLRQALRSTERLVGSLTLEKGVNCTIGVDFWNDFGTHGPRQMTDRNTLCGVRFRRGQVVKVDFGHLNIGREQSFGHMAIVLGNFKGLIVVVPIQTDRNQIFPQDTTPAILKLSAQLHPFLAHNSLLLVHQIQAVSKNRIYEDTGHTVIQDPIMEELEKKLVQLFSPYAKKLYTDQITALRAEVVTMNQEIQSKDAYIASLEALVTELRGQIVDQSSNAAATRTVDWDK